MPSRSDKSRRKGGLKRWAILAVAAGFSLSLVFLFAAALTGLRFLNPPTTGVQIQRRIEALTSGRIYHESQRFVPLPRISADLQHAVIAAEDGRFYQHTGIDWKQVEKVAQQTRETGELSRGASTITQQLVKNLFFTTHRNPIRKALEYVLAPMADRILGKQRQLELYLNVVEWGDGIFGADAAAQRYYGIPAARLNREQAARMPACLPSPRRRTPARMNEYGASILARMRQMGW